MKNYSNACLQTKPFHTEKSMPYKVPNSDEIEERIISGS